LGLADVDFGAGRRACPRSEKAFLLRGAALIDTPGFYGNLGASGMLHASFALRPYFEMFSTLEFLRFQFVQNATLKGTSAALGQMTIGWNARFVERPHVALSQYTRWMLPTNAPSNVRVVGGEVGLALSYRPKARFALHSFIAGDITAGISAGPLSPRAGLSAGLGVQWAPWRFFALALDLQTALGHRAILDYLAPVLGLRFRLYRGLGLELDASRSVLGADQRLFVAALRLGWIW
jgi:hypothetical protein